MQTEHTVSGRRAHAADNPPAISPTCRTVRQVHSLNVMCLSGGRPSLTRVPREAATNLVHPSGINAPHTANCDKKKRDCPKRRHSHIDDSENGRRCDRQREVISKSGPLVEREKDGQEAVHNSTNSSRSANQIKPKLRNLFATSDVCPRALATG